MEFRKSKYEDVKQIVEIINKAQEYMKNNNIDQWQNGYPNEDTIINDINREISYVLVDNNIILATTVLMFDKEKTYDKIYDGNWLSDNEYSTIHRICVDEKLKGQNIAGKMLKEVEKICTNKNIFSIKVDTHEDNKSMQNLLIKNGYTYCGVIYLVDGAKRIAFEKIIK